MTQHPVSGTHACSPVSSKGPWSLLWLLFQLHRACLLSSSILHPTMAAVLDDHSMVPPSPKCWSLCCSWAAFWLMASPGFFHGVKPQLLSMNPLMLGFQLLLRLPFLRWSILNSQSAGTQLLFLSLCFQSQYDLDDSSNTKFRCQHNGQPWLSLEHSFRVLNLTKHFPEDFTSMILVFSWSSLVS